MTPNPHTTPHHTHILSTRTGAYLNDHHTHVIIMMVIVLIAKTRTLGHVQVPPGPIRAHIVPAQVHIIALIHRVALALRFRLATIVVVRPIAANIHAILPPTDQVHLH